MSLLGSLAKVWVEHIQFGLLIKGGSTRGEEPTCQCREQKRPGSDLGWEGPWRRAG